MTSKKPSPATELVPLARDLWCKDDELRGPAGVIFPIRMTVVKDSRGLILISPTDIDDALAKQLADMGPVHHIVAPNRFHHVWLEKTARRYPDATCLIARGVDKHYQGDAERLEDRQNFSDAITTHHIAGAPRLNEYVFHHAASQTLIVTDLLFNMKKARSTASWLVFRLLARALGRPAQSRMIRWVTKDRAAAANSVATLLELDFDRLVMAHGDIIESDGRTTLESAVAWMLSSAERSMSDVTTTC